MESITISARNECSERKRTLCTTVDSQYDDAESSLSNNLRWFIELQFINANVPDCIALLFLVSKEGEEDADKEDDDDRDDDQHEVSRVHTSSSDLVGIGLADAISGGVGNKFAAISKSGVTVSVFDHDSDG
jgi:hypothetical protein